MTLTGRGRPQQRGRLIGANALSGNEHSVDVTWLVDTEAALAAVRDSVGRQFGRQPITGATASTTTGVSAGIVVTGLQAEFTVTDRLGKPHTVRSSPSCYTTIKPNDGGSDLLGMNQLSDVSATVHWDPRGGVGSLRFRGFGDVAVGLLAAIRTWRDQ
ncbi:hypothetical protein A5745_22270 [Mycobacterium sp. IS-2888]|uniref:hypothetical protein n=1 Tax=Mycobacterium sp. IS-2888 TaxID=1834159 RepID=UPI000979E1EA|nr:hypothetical protein [Mycobacterium sp. IS-2888]OMC53261.1 hypothetical protein A5745_22270 [Mycobacterium sp. IS-2888]